MTYAFGDAYSPEQWSAFGSMLQGVSTVVAIGVAVAAALYAKGQVKEARLLREEQARPFVVVDFVPSAVWSNLIDLVFENVGGTLATNVRFHFDPPLKSSRHAEDGYDFYQAVLFTEGIPAMPPGKRVSALFDLSHERIKTDLPMKYRVRVESQDAQGRQQPPLEYILDLDFYYGLRQVSTNTMHNAAKSLEQIEKHMRSWTQHFNGIRVWTRDEDAYLARESEEYGAWKAQQEDTTPPDDQARGSDGTEP